VINDETGAKKPAEKLKHTQKNKKIEENDNKNRQWLKRIIEESDMSCPDETYILAACVGKEEKISVCVYHKGDSKKKQ
jgi:hypothetical protein